MLDFARLLPDIHAMVAEQANARPELANAARNAINGLQQLSADDWEAVSEIISTLPLSHLMATFIELPDSRIRAPAFPARHTVIAADGSQIPPDRQEIAFCYVINIGTVYLPYGYGERVVLNSEPRLFYREDELVEEHDGEVQSISPKRIGSLRLQAECKALIVLLEMAAERRRPAIAMMDGTLILWSLEAESPAVRLESLSAFESLLNRARELRIPVVGYISRPGSSDVVNTLKAWSCGLENAECRLKCSSGRLAPPGAPCRKLLKTSDHALFGQLLAPGQRSALFGSQSKILRSLNRGNRIVFFYVNVGGEIARVELPAWASEDPELLGLVHSVVLDQNAKGLGYPRALIEAHEKAVVRAADRTAFFDYVEREMARRRISAHTTRKSVSKRVPTI